MNYQIGDQIELYRKTNNVSVNGGYAECEPIRATITQVGPDARYFVAETKWRRYTLDGRGRHETPLFTYYTRTVES